MNFNKTTVLVSLRRVFTNTPFLSLHCIALMVSFLLNFSSVNVQKEQFKSLSLRSYRVNDLLTLMFDANAHMIIILIHLTIALSSVAL